MIHTGKNNYFIEKVMECGKDKKAFYRVIDSLHRVIDSLHRVIDSLQYRNRAALLPILQPLLIGAAEEFSEFFFTRIQKFEKNLMKARKLLTNLFNANLVTQM